MTSTVRHCVVNGPGGVIEVGRDRGLVVIAGPCVLESDDLCQEVAEVVRDACGALGLGYIFKGSFDKANRTSGSSPRGPGMERGLEMLSRVRAQVGVAVTTDVHEAAQAQDVAQHVDLLQIPAFLCRQTDLLEAASEAAVQRGRGINIKKGQFLSPKEMLGPIRKCEAAGCSNVLVTERGTFFGYHRLVTDFIGMGDLMDLAEVEAVRDWSPPPVCFDATHSAQLPGASSTTGGRRDRVELLARAAVAAGVDAVFLECHPDPANAQSDASTMLALADVPKLLEELASIAQVVRSGRRVAPKAERVIAGQR
ncbi:MAG: 3-deoxy-8-phosphooctulonate synthase [Phycisphaerales bacterium]|nr:3-deoxy-8-phosphooctulonate synthase [Phycisphaerales bacterium]